MNAKQLAELVKQMREAQKTFFRERSQQWLSLSKELERRVDAEITRILDSQKELF